MNKSSKNNIVIVGPVSNTEEQLIGGVATHMTLLRTLSVFKDAHFIDPGSLQNTQGNKIRAFVKGYTYLKSLLQPGTQLLINPSIYTFSLIKLCTVLAIAKLQGVKDIKIYFHGGKLSTVKSSGFLGRVAVYLVKSLLPKNCQLYFLSNEQLVDFKVGVDDATVQKIQLNKFCNYSLENDLLVDESDDDNFEFLFVGRVEKEKGIYELMEAFLAMAEMHPQSRLKIAGKGAELETLQSRYKAHSNIAFLGFVQGEAVNKLYQRAHCVVLPSYAEGFPFVYVEAMRAGKPLIATKVGALTSLIDGRNGTLIDPKSVVQLQEAMINMCRVNTSDIYSSSCVTVFNENLSLKAANYYYEIESKKCGEQ